DTTIVLVGVAETVEALVRDHQSIQRAISQVPMPRMEAKELREIIENATKSLREKSSVPIEFEAAAIDRIVRISQGLPHYTHLASLHSLRAACDACSEVVGLQHVKEGFRRAVAQADQTTAHSYRVATASAQQDALYRDVLLACAVAAFGSEDPEGYFQPSAVQEPLRVILDRPRVDVSTFNRHLKEFCDRKREKVLERRGQERNYRYRFRLPLMAPYAAIRGMSEDAITYEAFEDLLRRE
ncbi:MAG TPA: hypothetical protein VEI02_16170, partial [Planctomycetota bacterium]|nr:hypothetical protein [Planctomycetota bacterium]